MDKKITLYALTTCVFCQAIKKMFTDLGVCYEYIEVDSLEGEERSNALESLKEINKKCSFPTTVIDDEVVLGYQVQQIKEHIGIRTVVDELYEKLQKINEKKGYYFNRNKEQTFELLRGLLTNKDRYGYMACPCRLALGERDKDRDILCPCDYRKLDVAEFGSCYCGLYVSRQWNDGSIQHVDVPERRPVERI